MKHLQLADSNEGMSNWFSRAAHAVTNTGRRLSRTAPGRYLKWAQNRAEKIGFNPTIRLAKSLRRYGNNALYNFERNPYYMRAQHTLPARYLRYGQNKFGHYVPMADGLESRFGRWIHKQADNTGKVARRVAKSKLAQLVMEYGPDALALIPGTGPLSVAAKYGARGIKGLNTLNRAVDAADTIQGLTRIPPQEALPDAPTDQVYNPPSPPQQFFPTATRTQTQRGFNPDNRMSSVKSGSTGMDMSTLLPVAAGLAALYFISRKK